MADNATLVIRIEEQGPHAPPGTPKATPATTVGRPAVPPSPTAPAVPATPAGRRRAFDRSVAEMFGVDAATGAEVPPSPRRPVGGTSGLMLPAVVPQPRTTPPTPQPHPVAQRRPPDPAVERVRREAREAWGRTKRNRDDLSRQAREAWGRTVRNKERRDTARGFAGKAVGAAGRSVERVASMTGIRPISAATSGAAGSIRRGIGVGREVSATAKGMGASNAAASRLAVAAGAATAIAGLGVAAAATTKAVIDMGTSLNERVGRYAPESAAALANEEVTKLLRDILTAQRNQHELATIANINAKMYVVSQEIQSRILTLAGPALEFFSAALDVIEYLMDVPEMPVQPFAEFNNFVGGQAVAGLPAAAPGAGRNARVEAMLRKMPQGGPLVGAIARGDVRGAAGAGAQVGVGFWDWVPIWIPGLGLGVRAGGAIGGAVLGGGAAHVRNGGAR